MRSLGVRLKGWVNVTTLAENTGIPRATWDVWAHRYKWQSLRMNGRLHYHWDQVRPRILTWEAREAA